MSGGERTNSHVGGKVILKLKFVLILEIVLQYLGTLSLLKHKPCSPSPTPPTQMENPSP